MTEGGETFDDGEALGGIGGRWRTPGEVGAEGGEFAEEGGLGGDGTDFGGDFSVGSGAGDLDVAGVGVGQHGDAIAAVEADLAAFFTEAIGDLEDGPGLAGVRGVGLAKDAEEADAASVEFFGEGEAGRGNVAEDELGDGDVVGGEIPGAVHIGAGAGPVGAVGADTLDGAEFVGAGERGEGFDTGMVAPDVADEESSAGEGD